MHYIVYIEEKREYRIPVEAGSKEEAEEQAIMMMTSKYEEDYEIETEVEECKPPQ